MTLKSHAKFEEKLTGGFENNMRSLEIFIRTLGSVKIETLVGFFCPGRKCMNQKFTEELYVMALKNDENLKKN